ncbi:LysR family transcriptional regulator [Massilia frigida]|uniref:LysR family transcriptional regulator n=1 Tax=Massilia frigida TaxID=2609281 RepID=UPI002804C30B|nr:LysR family transcriptional regulator [Massilia frigida]
MMKSIGNCDGVRHGECILIGNLTLDQLRVLVTIADTGSFSAAGRQLGRVQSAIS